MRQDLVTQLHEELALVDISVSDDVERLLVAYLEFILERNKTVNLTRITDYRDAVTLHLVDSLLPLAVKDIPLTSSHDLLDMGTGAGFPGLPLCLACQIRGTLVDSVAKKVSAVNDGISSLSISGVAAVHGRLEELAHDLSHSQDLVVARAVAQAPVLIEYATPFLRKGGLLVLEKGNPTSEELDGAERAAKICGLRFVSRETFELPRNLGHREILFYQRFRSPQIELPRKIGAAKKSPLG